jgi:glutathione reductase (NADPH)
MSQSFDLVVVGTGSAAKTIAHECRSAGWSVAVVDSRPFGGTCANRGCDPKKVLVGVAEVLDAIHRMKDRGIDAPGASIRWSDLMRFKHSFTDPVPASTEQSFAAAGISAFHGEARFISPDALEVAGERIEAGHFAICAGAAPARLNIPGEELLLTSDDFLDLEDLPETLVFVGGGYIAFEFAHLAARAGAHTTILHRGERPLEGFDPFLVDMLVAHSRSVSIDVRLGHAVEGIERTPDGVMVRVAGGESIAAATAVHAAGRVPNLDALNLRAANVETGKRGVVVNEFLASPGNSKVYAAGDASGSDGLPLTPVAGYEGAIVASNLLHDNKIKSDYSGCASTVFTIPPLASVGFTEQTARDRGLEFDVHAGNSSDWYSSRRLAELFSGYKVLVERGSDRILGAHLFGDSAEEHINVFALAIRAGVPAATVKETLFAYPTHGSNTHYML